MRIMGFGLNLSGEPIFQEIDASLFAQALISHLEQNAEGMEMLSKTTSAGSTFK